VVRTLDRLCHQGRLTDHALDAAQHGPTLLAGVQIG
jgi:hypothetical protein